MPQAMQPSKMAPMPPRCTASAPSCCQGAASQATPAKPSSRAESVAVVGRWPPGQAHSVSTMNSGPMPMVRAAMPKAPIARPQTTEPLPPSSRKEPDRRVHPPLVRRRPRGAPELQESEQQRAGDQETRPRHQERRHGFHRDPDAEVGAAPDQVDGGEGDDEGTAAGHAFGPEQAPRKPGGRACFDVARVAQEASQSLPSARRDASSTTGGCQWVGVAEASRLSSSTGDVMPKVQVFHGCPATGMRVLCA
jgi:hypothetical protein